MMIPSQTRRAVARSVPDRPIPARLVQGERIVPVEIRDYSASGIGLRYKRNQRLRLQGSPDVQLIWNGTELDARIVYHSDREADMHLGLKFRNGADDRIAFSSKDHGWDLIDDSATIDQIIQDIEFKSSETELSLRYLSSYFSAKLSSVLPDGKMELLVEQGGIPGNPIGPLEVKFEIFKTHHAFRASVLKVNENLVTIERPQNVARLLRRETNRMEETEKLKSCRVFLRLDALGFQRKEFRIFDLSEGGLAVIDDSGVLCIPSGMPVEEVVFENAEGQRILASGIIRSYRSPFKATGSVVGIELNYSQETHRNAWNNQVLALRYPDLSFDYRDSDHDQIWDLFERSGYLHLKGRQAYSSVMEITRKTWNILQEAGSLWSKRAILRKDGRVSGMIQMDQMYPDTWCIHHLAIDPVISKTVAKELYAVTTDVLLSEGGQYLFSFSESSKAWNQRSYYDFISKYRFPEHNEMKTFQIYEASSEIGNRTRPETGCEIRAANRWDYRRICRFFELHVSELERNAFGLTLDSMDLSEIAVKMKKDGIQRYREFVIAVKDGELLGVARVETSTPGINIVGIFDMLYVDIRPDLDAEAAVIRDLLIDEAMRRFRALGKDKVIVALDDGDVSHHVSNGLEFVTDATRWIAKREILPRYHAFSQFLYGHLILTREKIRQKKHSK